MSLTSSQEETLKQIIEAFQNGKRLSDLPDVKGTNPYNLFVEVLDEDGESKKAALAALLPYAEERASYGIEFDTEVSSPSCLRIGNSDLHKTLPVHSRMKGCLLDDSGQVVEYLNPKDWTVNTRDGSRGQVMIEIPMHYRKFETDGTKRRVLLSELPLPGYHQVPKVYVSAYEATIQRSKNMLASVTNDSTEYRGGNNNADWDGTYRSLLGRAATNISRTDARIYARKRKPETAEWNCMIYEVQKSIYWLFCVEYATLNTQADYNPEPTPEGFRQGGLGQGVTTWDSNWGVYNNYYPFVPCGHTDKLGNGTGVVKYTLRNDGNSDFITLDVPRYRGIENVFGHIWEWVDGINLHVERDADKGGNGLSKVFICGNPSKFNDSNYDGYSNVGNEARNSGFITEILFGEFGEIVSSSSSGGGATTYHCDSVHVNITKDDPIRAMLYGGYAAHGASAGLIRCDSSNTPETKASNIGTRLCFFPD